MSNAFSGTVESYDLRELRATWQLEPSLRVARSRACAVAPRIGDPSWDPDGHGWDPRPGRDHLFIKGKDIPGTSQNHGSVKDGSLQFVVSFHLGFH